MMELLLLLLLPSESSRAACAVMLHHVRAASVFSILYPRYFDTEIGLRSF